MSLADLIYPFTRRGRQDDRIERESAALCDANLARLRHTDPDAARIFTTGTTRSATPTATPRSRTS